jgi:hypothetical protein
VSPRPVTLSALAVLASLGSGLVACDGCGREPAPPSVAAPAATGYALTGPRLTRAPRKTHPDVSDAAAVVVDGGAP